MPHLQRPCGAKIYYETKGRRGDIPVLLLAPGGMRSSIHIWGSHPYNPWRQLDSCSDATTSMKAGTSSSSNSRNIDETWSPSIPKFHLIGMDQRFANNRSTGTVRKDDGWHTFLADQLALLDHLQIQKCHIVGSCIGPSYAFQLLKTAPERFGRCVMLQPIGLTRHTTEPDHTWVGLNSSATWSWVGDWAKERQKDRPADLVHNDDEDPHILKELHDTMFGPPRDFVFSITRQEAAKIQHPLLIFMGKDINHPSETSREISRLAPNTELVEVWRDAGSEKLVEADLKIKRFLQEGGNCAPEESL
jgi:pimeloyl-ACP methyl ester carboxylesterase